MINDLKVLINKYKYIIKILISIILIFLVIKNVNIKNVLHNIIILKWYIFFILILQTCLQLFTNALIKRTMLDIFNYKEELLSLYKIMFIGSFYGFFMPSMVGGDAYYTYNFGKKINSYPKIISGLFLIKFIGISVFFFLISIITVFYRNKIFADIPIESINLQKYLPVFIGILLIIIIILFLIKRGNNKIGKILKKISTIKDNFLKNTDKLLTITFYSLLFYFIAIGCRVLVGKLIGINLSIIQLASIIMVANFILLIPVTVSGIGLRESAYVGLMSIFGIDPSTALTLSILDFSVSIIALFIGGIILLIDSFGKAKYLYKKSCGK